jgi:transposase
VRIADERNIEQLRRKAELLLVENERLSKKVVELLRENLSLKGMSAEQLQQALELLDEELNKVKSNGPGRPPSTERRGAAPSGAVEKKPQVGHGPSAQPSLPVMAEEHDLDDADKVCPTCGGQLELWEGQEDESYEVDVIERRFVMKKHVRKKYRCACGCIEMPETPPRLVPGGRYSNDFAVEVAVDKYADHQPLERQVRGMARDGLVVESQTLWDQLEALATKLEPAWQALLADAIREAVLGFDETHWDVLTKGSASKKSWTMWQLSTPRVVYFSIAPDGNSAAGRAFLKGFKGIALGDAAVIHKSMVKDAEYRLALCMAHGRRKFVKAEANDPIRSRQFIEMVQELYVIEAQAPPGPDGDELRRKLRAEQSKPVMDRMKAWLLEQRFLPASDFGKAVKYALGNWAGLSVFLTEPAVPIDNNRTERGFRGPALGRHNFYGSKSRRGTEVAAIFYSLIETAKLNGVNPKQYLKTALAAALAGERIPLPHEFV